MTIYSPMLAYWCLKNRLRGDDAADVIQEVLSIVFQRICEFDHRSNGSFRGWLYVITQSQIAEFYRRKNRHRELSPQQANALQAPRNADEDQADLAGIVRRTLQVLEDKEELPRGPREAFLAHFFEQRSIEDIAEETGMTSGAIRNRINRAAAKLRELLAPELQDWDAESDGHPLT